MNNRKPLLYPMQTAPMQAAPMGQMPTGVVPAGQMPAAAFEYDAPMQAGPMQTAPMQAGPMQAGPMQAGPGQSASRTPDTQRFRREMGEMMRKNLMPPGFDLLAAVQDRAFIGLTKELPLYAAVRVYDAEQRAAQAEQQAVRKVMEQLMAREGLPRSARADAAAPAERDYLSMSPEEFARVEREYREKARKGIKVKL